MTIPNLPMIRPKKPIWNKGRIVGQKRALQPKHVWAIRVRLELADRHRDLALFNMAVDSKLRGCDLVRLKVEDVYAAGYVKERASIVQSKTQRPVQFEITETTRTSLDAWLEQPEMFDSKFLWPSRLHESPHISTRQYGRMLKGWVRSIGLEPNAYGTHSMALVHGSVSRQDCPYATSSGDTYRDRSGEVDLFVRDGDTVGHLPLL